MNDEKINNKVKDNNNLNNTNTIKDNEFLNEKFDLGAKDGNLEATNENFTNSNDNNQVSNLNNNLVSDSKHIDISLKDRISSEKIANIGLDQLNVQEDGPQNNNHNQRMTENFPNNEIVKKSDHKNSNTYYKDMPTFNLQEVLIMVLLTGIICTIASGTIVNHKYSTKNGTSYNTLLKDENIQEFLDVYATLNDSYYESVDKKAAIEGAISGLMSSAGDNYTSYLDKDDADSLNNSLNGKYEGIGIAINSKETGLIEKVYQNSPAAEAGLQKGDKITVINSENIDGKSSSDIAKLIKESSDKKVNLTILRGEETFDVEVKIKSLSTPVVDYSILEGNNKKVGYLAISSFSDTLANQVEDALNDMETAGIESLIIDLRNNGGGLLTAAKDTASLFLEKGKAIYGLEGNDKTSKTKFYYDETATSRTYPIVVLVNGGTASASEILTAALIDSYGATTVGTTTYGKGKVQQTKKLSDGSLVKYTTARWLTPNNECIDEYGISPDYGVEIEYEYDDEKNIVGYTDTQLAKAKSLLGLPDNEEINDNSQN